MVDLYQESVQSIISKLFSGEITYSDVVDNYVNSRISMNTFLAVRSAVPSDYAAGTRMVFIGTYTITAGNTSTVIAHGRSLLPTLGRFLLTPLADLGGYNLYPSSVDSTNVTITLTSMMMSDVSFGLSYIEG